MEFKFPRSRVLCLALSVVLALTVSWAVAAPAQAATTYTVSGTVSAAGNPVTAASSRSPSRSTIPPSPRAIRRSGPVHDSRRIGGRVYGGSDSNVRNRVGEDDDYRVTGLSPSHPLFGD
jgi:hypothetical protein